MKTIPIGLFCLSFFTASYAQQNTVASGGDASGSNGSASYTIGQIDYVNVSSASYEINAGVQQPFEFFKVGLEEESIVTALYPNPTFDELNLIIESFQDKVFRIFDAKGKLVQEGTILEKETIINVKNFASGSYQLLLLTNDQALETIQIIKH